MTRTAVASGPRFLVSLVTILAAVICGAPAQVWAVEKASEQVSSYFGSFSQAIPIEVPAFRGLEPELALTYSSETRNGFVGVGWSVTGFATIQRVNAGLGSPMFDSGDVYLLDGQELFPCQAGSVSPSCTTGGTHSTKVERYIRIKFDPVQNLWTVWSKDGMRTLLSPLINVPPNPFVPGGTLRWGVSSRIDTDGNTASYVWSCLDGDCSPSTASYNGYQVAFFKETRPDWLSWAGATVLGETRYRLRSVIVSAPSASANIRGYKLTYAPSTLTGRSLLTSVQQYGKDLVHSAGLLTGGTTLPAQTFTYQNDTIGKSFVDWNAPATPPAYSTGVTWANHVNSAPTGNGSTLLKTGGSQSEWDAGADSTYAIASGNGYVQWTSSQPVTNGKAAGLSFGNTDTTMSDIDFAFAEVDNNLLSVVENGVIRGTWPRADQDILRVEVSAGIVYFKQNGTIRYQSLVVPTYPLRVDASLRGASSTLQDVTISGALINVNAWCQALLFSGDFNGDGRTDQLCQSNLTGATVSLSSEVGLLAPTTWLAGGIPSNPVLADFNNDGKTDLAKHDPWSGQFSVSLSTGSSFGAWADWGTAIGNLPNGTAVDCRVNPASVGSGDFNGDGLTDVYCHLFGPNQQFIGLSTGTSFTFSLFSAYGCDTAGGDQQVGAIDFDGDGKDDWYCIGSSTSNTLSVFPSTGSSFQYPAHGSVSFCNGSGYVLGDVNGDGRTDVTCMYTGAVALSTGRSFQTTGPYGGGCGGGQGLAADVDGDGASELICNNAGAGPDDIQVRKWRGAGQAQALGAAETWKANWCGGQITAGDWNGDGKTDLYCKSTVTPAVAGTGGLVVDLIGTTDNGMGGTAQVAYVPSSVFSHTNNPPVKQVVSSIATQDGVGGSTTSSFVYSGGLMDRRERRFLGFRYSRKTLPCISGEATCPYLETWFRQDLASVGQREKTIQRHGDGNILAMQTFAYATNGAAIPRTSLLTSETTFSYDAIGCPASPCAQEKATTVTHTYDAYGNVASTSWDGEPGVAKDNRSTTWEYTANAAKYIVRLVGRERHFDFSGAQTAATKYTYDRQGLSSSWTTPPEEGHLTHLERWLNTGDRWVTTAYEHDSFGNRTKVTDPTAVSVTTTYDTARRLFPETVTNLGAPSETTTTTWDPVCGLPSTQTDANAQVSVVQSDALCRKSRIDLPLGGFEITSYRDFGNPALQRVVVETPSAVSGGANKFVATHVDGLGRAFRSVSTGPSAGIVIVTDTSYNARGLVSSKTAPYYAGEASYATGYSYDALDRLTEVAYPDGNAVAKAYGLRSEMTTDENGQLTTLRFDAYGRLVAKERALAGSLVATQFGYDALDRRTSMADELGNSWSWQFDSLGRTEQISDPDAGVQAFAYDDADRLDQKTDAKGQRIELDYDLAGRRSQKRTYDASNGLTGQVSFVYSEARPSYFNKGRPTSIAGPGPTSLQLDYDARGRTARQRRQVDLPIYETTTTYDAGGRILSRTHPDGSIGPFGYDGAGRVRSIPGILTDVAYDASGRPTMQANANGTISERSYSPLRGFLEGIQTSGSYTLQDLTYGLDATGRVDSVTSPFPQESWSYQYDDLYRMTAASSLSQGLSQTFTYDEIDRITFNSRVGTYSYPPPGAPRPHAPLAAGPKSYTYDAGGNLSVGDARTYTWNVENKPTQVNTTSYAYDGLGTRLKKVTSLATTIYPFGDEYQIVGSVATKYISAPGLGVIAKRTGTQTFWLHTDRVGSVNVVTNNVGSEEDRTTFRPYGEVIQTGPHVEALGWIGERLDETGLMYLHARYYDPAIGTFISPDPIGPAGGLNEYGYANGDPVNLSDRGGHMPGPGMLYAADYAAFVRNNTCAQPGGCYRDSATVTARMNSALLDAQLYLVGSGVPGPNDIRNAMLAAMAAINGQANAQNTQNGVGQVGAAASSIPVDSNTSTTGTGTTDVVTTPAVQPTPNPRPAPAPPSNPIAPNPNTTYMNLFRRHPDVPAERANFPGVVDPYGGAYRHCVAGCILRQTFGEFGAQTAVGWWDLIGEPAFRGANDNNSLHDMAGEQHGIWVGGQGGQCGIDCTRAYPPGGPGQ
jgi:RHS repeat-associated protein